jgi:DNA recombination protein RmuC
MGLLTIGISTLVSLTLVLVAITGWLAWTGGASRERRRLEPDLVAERSKAASLAVDAGRLSDASARADRAEKRVAELNDELRSETGHASAAQTAYKTLVVDAKTSEERCAQLQEQVEKQNLTVATATAAAEARHNEIQRLKPDLDAASTELNQLRTALLDKSTAYSQASAERDAALSQVKEITAFLDTAKKNLTTAFLEAASGVFDDKSTALNAAITASGNLSKEQLTTTLGPFAELITGFRTRVDALAADDSRDRATLVGAIGELKTLNQEMADATNAMTRALKGNAKARGDWGEMILDSVLSLSGLEKGRQYRKLVIDSKVNLVAWAEANEVEPEEERQDALKRHAAAMRQHVLDLAKKNYPRAVDGQVLQQTLMFVPIEAAMSAALSVDKKLHEDAWKSQVIFATPNTLMLMAFLCERLWTRDKQRGKIDEIVKTANLLVDSVIAFKDGFEDIGAQIKKAAKAHEVATGQLTESTHSIMARARRLVVAGAKGKSTIPDGLLPDDDSPVPMLANELGVGDGGA